MAEGKKSFILYADLLSTVEKLPVEMRGELFTIILKYVNDQNPEPENLILQIAFEPIKLQLKRDLKQWESTSVFRSESGKKGGLKSGESRRSKQTKQVLKARSKPKQTEANEADTVTVTVNVNDTVTEKEKEKEINIYNPLCEFIKKNYHHVSKLPEQLTSEEAERLLIDFTKEDIKDYLQRMDNYKPLIKNNRNVNRTLRNWIRKDREKKAQTANNGQGVNATGQTANP